MNVRIVLVRPRNPGNIGACARAMSNFGFSDLVVVDPYRPIWEESRAAPDAEDVVKAARAVPTLEVALRGCHHVWGTSSYAHRKSEQAIIPLPRLHEVVAHVKPRERVALLLGSERSGLSNAELALCQTVIQIPMVRAGVSMNLAQALAVILYEWSRTSATSAAPRAPEGNTNTDLVEAWIGLAKLVGYPPGYTDAARAGRIRRAMQGSALGPETPRFFLSFSRWLTKTIRKRPA